MFNIVSMTSPNTPFRCTSRTCTLLPSFATWLQTVRKHTASAKFLLRTNAAVMMANIGRDLHTGCVSPPDGTW